MKYVVTYADERQIVVESELSYPEFIKAYPATADIHPAVSEFVEETPKPKRKKKDANEE